MFKTTEGHMKVLLEEALNKLEKSSAHKRPHLFSITKEINAFDPILCFEKVEQLRDNRIFWSDPTISMVAIGKAYEMTAEKSRFDALNKQWQQCLHTAFVYNPDQTPGTGLVAFGGMSFDPKKPKTALWEKFKTSQFIIPQYILTKNSKGHYLTVNVELDEHDELKQIDELIDEIESILAVDTVTLPERAHILNREEIEPEIWKETVEKAKYEIKYKGAQKIVLARELRLQLNKQVEVSPVVKQLIDTQPTSYVFAFEVGEDCFVGATPERLVKVEGQKVLSTCLAGTAPRGKTKEEDERIHQELLHDKKNLEEHHHVVQMITDAMVRYCDDVQVADHPIVYPLKNLQHLYTPVSGTLKQGYSMFDIAEKLHPTPALGGTPTEYALEFIREHELLDRGWYGAPIGWLDSNQNGELAVAIRSALIQKDQASLFAGCGIMEDSDVQTEYEETNIKFQPMLTVFGG